MKNLCLLVLFVLTSSVFANSSIAPEKCTCNNLPGNYRGVALVKYDVNENYSFLGRWFGGDNLPRMDEARSQCEAEHKKQIARGVCLETRGTSNCPSIPDFLRVKEIRFPASFITGNYEVVINIPNIDSLPNCEPMGRAHGFRLTQDHAIHFFLLEQATGRLIQKNECMTITYARTLGDGGWGTLGFDSCIRRWLDFPIVGYAFDAQTRSHKIYIDLPASGTSRYHIEVPEPTFW